LLPDFEALNNQLCELGVHDPEAGEEGLLWHYTTFDGLDGILKKGALWLHDTAFMNDRTELVYLINNLRLTERTPEEQQGILRVIRDDEWGWFGTAYVSSLIKKADLLSQWNAYGNGVSIGFDLKVFKDICHEHEIFLKNCDYGPRVPSGVNLTLGAHV
jgi:hypothetical protein